MHTTAKAAKRTFKTTPGTKKTPIASGTERGPLIFVNHVSVKDFRNWRKPDRDIHRSL
jgi:hypothetical protein